VKRSDDRARAEFEQLFRDTRKDLLAYALRRSPTIEDAADIVADTYLIAWQRLERVPRGDEARLWLFGVARNLLRKGAQRHRSGDLLVQRLATELRRAGLAAAPRQGERFDAVQQALGRVPARDRELLTMTAWEGLTPEQIAKVMGLSANVVRVRLHRARSRLRRELDRPRPVSALGEKVAMEGD
jgi:RNA polymerase sigma-70 factor (ECF subfamily)